MMRYIVGMQVAFELLIFIAIAGLVASLLEEAVFAVGRWIRRKLWLRRNGIRQVHISGMVRIPSLKRRMDAERKRNFHDGDR